MTYYDDLPRFYDWAFHPHLGNFFEPVGDEMIKLYTIGFAGKSAQRFFDLLEQNQVRQIIDTRISNN